MTGLTINKRVKFHPSQAGKICAWCGDHLKKTAIAEFCSADCYTKSIDVKVITVLRKVDAVIEVIRPL